MPTDIVASIHLGHIPSDLLGAQVIPGTTYPCVELFDDTTPFLRVYATDLDQLSALADALTVAVCQARAALDPDLVGRVDALAADEQARERALAGPDSIEPF